MKKLIQKSPQKAPPETTLADFAKHLRNTHFLIVFSATFLIIVSFQLPISPIQKSIQYIQKIKLLNHLALEDLPTQEVNIMNLIVTHKKKQLSVDESLAFPSVSTLMHNQQKLYINWNRILPLIENIKLPSSRENVAMKSIGQLPFHSLNTFEDFKHLWNWHNQIFHVHMPQQIARKVLVLEQSQSQPPKPPSATIQDLKNLDPTLEIPINSIFLNNAVSTSDFIKERFPFIPFHNPVAATYINEAKEEYNIFLVIQATSSDIRTPLTLVVPISAKIIEIRAQYEISELVNASWSEGLFEDCFPELELIMPEIKDSKIDLFDFDLIRKIYPAASQIEQQKINILGFTINGIQMLSWGPLLVVIIQLYFYIFYRQFYHHASNIRHTLVFPWIGFSADILGRIVYFISIIVLPVITLFIAADSLQYSPISKYQVLLNFKYVSFIIASLTARIIIFKEWRKTIK